MYIIKEGQYFEMRKLRHHKVSSCFIVSFRSEDSRGNLMVFVRSSYGMTGIREYIEEKHNISKVRITGISRVPLEANRIIKRKHVIH
jgi:hypothetical protein